MIDNVNAPNHRISNSDGAIYGKISQDITLYVIPVENALIFHFHLTLLKENNSAFYNNANIDMIGHIEVKKSTVVQFSGYFLSLYLPNICMYVCV